MKSDQLVRSLSAVIALRNIWQKLSLSIWRANVFGETDLLFLLENLGSQGIDLSLLQVHWIHPDSERSSLLRLLPHESLNVTIGSLILIHHLLVDVLNPVEHLVLIGAPVIDLDDVARYSVWLFVWLILVTHVFDQKLLDHPEYDIVLDS